MYNTPEPYPGADALADAAYDRAATEDARYELACRELDRIETECPVRLPCLDGNVTPRTRAQRLRDAYAEYGGTAGEDDEALLDAILTDSDDSEEYVHAFGIYP